MIKFPDVSFLIPVRIDSDMRAKNLEYVINFISSNFSSSIFYMKRIRNKKFQKV